MIPKLKDGEIAIVGAGILGLSLAYYLANSGRRVTVFEKKASVGGFLDSVDVNGTLLEKYYHHLLMGFKDIISLANEIGMSDQIIWKQVRMGFQYKDKLYPFNGPLDLFNFSPLAFFDRLRFGIGIFRLSNIKNWEYLDKFSAEDLLRRQTGEESWSKIWKPLLKMKFGNAYGQVSAAWIWDRIKTRRGSQRFSKSREYLGYVKGGFRRLADRLSEIVVSKQGEISLSSPVSEISLFEGYGVRVSFAEGKQKSFSKLFSTIPPPVLLKAASFLPEQTAAMIEKIDYQNIVCVLLRLKKSLSGFYWINLVDDDTPFGVIIEHTNLMDPCEYGGENIVYLVRYCSVDDSFFNKDDGFIKDKARAALRKVSVDFSDKDIIKEEIFRDCFAQPIFCKGFAEIKKHLHDFKDITFVDSTQVYPYSRSTNSAASLAKNTANEFIKNE